MNPGGVKTRSLAPPTSECLGTEKRVTQEGDGGKLPRRMGKSAWRRSVLTKGATTKGRNYLGKGSEVPGEGSGRGKVDSKQNLPRCYR